MKRLFIILSVFFLSMGQLHAQEILQEVKNLMDGYEALKNDTKQRLDVRKVATFKYDALYYMCFKAEDESEVELGQQANAMIDFVNLFLKRMGQVKAVEPRARLHAKFRAVSLRHSRYNDVDKDIVEAYVDNDDFITNFSLDTDWVKALEAVKDL